MSVLSKEGVDEVIRYHRHRIGTGKINDDIFDLIDTIADRDKQVDDLRVKVKELEEQNKPFEHKFGCDGFLCTCTQAIKEPEVINA